jgi:2-methylisocitrate lyase-like PEP mutase family enzyme
LGVARLAELGVARISTGSLLFRAAVHSAVELARAVSSGGADAGDTRDVLSYDQAQTWSAVFAD